jgi:hypothetical protein
VEKLWTDAYVGRVGHLAAVVMSAACTLTWHGVPSPLLRGVELRAVAAAAPDDAWAVGGPSNFGRSTRTAPVIEHWDGTRWRVVPSPAIAGARLDSVVAAGRNDAWAVGARRVPGTDRSLGSVLEHWDGTRWRRVTVPVPGLAAIAAASSTDVWAAGNGSVVQWDGAHWRTQLRVQAVLADLAVLAANDVWVVGENAAGYLELHWDGNRWTRYAQRASNDSAELVAVAGSSGDVWAAGNVDPDGPTWPDTVVLHWTGGLWRRVAPPAFVFVNDLVVKDQGEVWLAGIRADGDAYGGGVLERLSAARWQGMVTYQVDGLAVDHAQGLWGVGFAGSYPDGMNFPTLVRPLIKRARCS